MSLIELPRLSHFQKSALGTYGERWSELRRSTTPVDRDEAEAGVALAYQAAGLPPPRQIIWGGSPHEIANQWVTASDAGGENVRSLVVDLVRRKAEAAVDRAIGVAVRTALAEEPRLSRVPAFCTSIDEAVARDCAGIKPTLRKRLTALLQLRRRPSLGFPAASFGFQATSALGVLEYFHDVCGLRRQTSALNGLWQIAKNAAWILPNERSCWLSERPTTIRTDINGRLHAPDGAALVYQDGWSVYAWKGVLVPSWIIDRPERVNIRAIAANHDPQIRRCMIDIMTPQRFIAEGGAYRVSQDETGILWRQRWRWEAWAAVEVVNGTAEPDGTHKHYFLQVPPTVRSAREAVAWTYGLTEQRYRPKMRT
ncbi:MAG TPA: hypothetical protein VKF35_00300 [Hyphomicrobiaceae bacterium]|nr:hypothetical protein [Hyphomicrobiaceae bacterium]